MSKLIHPTLALLRGVASGCIITKEAPPSAVEVKRGDTVELKFNWTAASDEEVRKALGSDAPEGYIAGWASTTSRDLYNHEVITGAFQKSIDERGLKGPAGIKFLLDHDHTKPAGIITVLEYRRGDLWMEAQFNLDVSYIKDRWLMLKMMGGANFSVGFMLQDYEVVIREEEDDYFLRIDRGDLFEVSSVLLPGNEECHNVFIKSRLSEDNPDDDQLFFAKAKTAAWKMGASKNLPISTSTTAFDTASAKARIFKAAGFDGDKPNYELCRKAFLAYDAANPELRHSYKLLVADVIDGKVQVTEGALRFAASRIANSDIPDTVKSAAMAVVQHYEAVADEEGAPSGAPQTQVEFEKALVARGLVKGRNEAREIARVAKTCPHLFQKKTEVIVPQQPALDAGKLTEALSLVQKMKAILTPAV